jgi:hypothetical protein
MYFRIYNEVENKYQIEDLNLNYEYNGNPKHIDAYIFFNDKLENGVRELEITQELSEIRPVMMDLSSSIKDIKSIYEINKKIKQFKKTAVETKGELDASSLPKELKNTIAQTMLFLIKDYGKALAQEGAARNQGIERFHDLNKRVQVKYISEEFKVAEVESFLDDLNKGIQEMRANLPKWQEMWKRTNKIQVDIKDTIAYEAKKCNTTNTR